MAKLTTTDKQILEKLFRMGDGYVLNFSDKTFAEFFRDDLGLNINDPKYQYASGSKANRMRGFWLAADERLVGKSIDKLLLYIDTQVAIGRLKQEDYSQELLGRARSISNRLAGRGEKGPTATERHASAQPQASSGVAPSAQALKELQEKLMQLHSLSPQERGFAFERFLNEVFGSFQLAPRGSFRLTGEQIDGSFQLGHDVYLVEAKWHSHQTGQSDLLAFSGKVEGKAQWSRGIFISYSGFSRDGLEAFSRGKSTRIVCMDGFDLICVLAHGIPLGQVISSKVRRAGETNDAFVSVRDLFPSTVF